MHCEEDTIRALDDEDFDLADPDPLLTFRNSSSSIVAALLLHYATAAVKEAER